MRYPSSVVHRPSSSVCLRIKTPQAATKCRLGTMSGDCPEAPRFHPSCAPSHDSHVTATRPSLTHGSTAPFPAFAIAGLAPSPARCGRSRRYSSASTPCADDSTRPRERQDHPRSDANSANISFSSRVFADQPAIGIGTKISIRLPSGSRRCAVRSPHSGRSVGGATSSTLYSRSRVSARSRSST